MAKVLQLRRGTTAEHSAFTGANGELTVNTTLKLLVLHDGSTVGGFQIPKLVSGKVPFAQLDVQDATTEQKGIVQLNDTITSTNTTQALTANAGKLLADRDFGAGQSWQDVTSSRHQNTTYTNTTGRPICVMVSYPSTQNFSEMVVNGLVVATQFSNSSNYLSVIVPHESTYRFNSPEANQISRWTELR